MRTILKATLIIATLIPVAAYADDKGKTPPAAGSGSTAAGAKGTTTTAPKGSGAATSGAKATTPAPKGSAAAPAPKASK